MSARFIRVVEDLNGNMFGDQASTGVTVVTGFPANAVLDNFDRANESPLAGNWAGPIQSSSGQAYIVGQLAAVGSGDPSGSYWNATTFNANQEAYMLMTAVNDYAQIWCRINTPGASVTGYCVQARKSTSELRIYRWDNESSPNQLGAAISQTITDGDSLGVKFNGTTIEAWYKVGAGAWTSAGTRTDSTYNTSGKIGMQFNSGSGIEDFGGGNS